MKKVLLASLLFGFGASVIAQNHKMAKPLGVNNLPQLAPNAIRYVDTQATSSHSNGHANKTQAINTVPTGFGPNAYSTLENSVNQVGIIPEMDYIAFIHRNDANTYGGNSGKLRIDFSADGGTTFTCDNGLLSQPGALPTGLSGITLNESVSASSARHPALAIYNPSGNTDPCNVVHVWTAPGLVGSDWAHLQTGAATHIDPSCGTQNFTAVSQPKFVYSTSLVSGNNGDFWYTTTKYVNVSLDPSDTVEVWKGTYNAGNINWSLKSNIKVGAFVDPSDNYPIIGRSIMAFSPDGTHGYVVVPAVDANKIYSSPKGNTRTTTMAWSESHDAGNTWSPMTFLDPWTVPGVKDSLSLYYLDENSNVDSAAGIPYVSSLDLVVDKYGKPHISFYVMNKFMDGTPANTDDSLGYISVGLPKFISELTLDGNNQWQSNHVAYLSGFKTTLGALDVYQTNQAARDPQGESVFFMFTDDSSTTSTTTMAPDLWTWSRMVDVNPTSPAIDHTTGDPNWDGKIWSPQLAPIVRPSGATAYPAIFFVNPGPTDVDAVTYQYVTDVSYPFPLAKESSLASNVLNLQAYPNPTKGELNISAAFTGMENGTIRIVDVMGRQVFTETFKGQNNIQKSIQLNAPAGLYILKVETSTGSSERKIVVE